MSNPSIDDLFSLLGKWRNLAGYPLETRAHPFFGLFLAKVLEEHLQIPINPLIIPEFPFLKNPYNNQSPKVDFFALSEDGKHAFFIEIKTDMESWREGQDEDLEDAAQNGLHEILEDLKSIAKATGVKNRPKYFHLLQALEELKLIKLPSELQNLAYSDPHREYRSCIEHIEVVGSDLKPEIIYILPERRPGKKTITFREFAGVIRKLGEIAERFAEALLEWAKLDAGSVPPGAKGP